MTTAAASTHNDDDDIQMDKNAFETRLFTLASSKPDIMVPSKRQALMASLMADVQQEDPQCRQWLAEWKGTYLYISIYIRSEICAVVVGTYCLEFNLSHLNSFT